MSIISPITFIDRLVKKNDLGHPFALMDHQREVLRLAFAFDQDGRLPWDTIIYSCIKKSGKTTLNGALTLGWGFTQEADRRAGHHTGAHQGLSIRPGRRQ